MGTRRKTVSLLLMSGIACIKEPWRTRNVAPRDARPGALQRDRGYPKSRVSITVSHGPVTNHPARAVAIRRVRNDRVSREPRPSIEIGVDGRRRVARDRDEVAGRRLPKRRHQIQQQARRERTIAGIQLESRGEWCHRSLRVVVPAAAGSARSARATRCSN